ncbi:MAG: hypothetical protein ACKVYV_11910 [Limisphaerales bacterium]
MKTPILILALLAAVASCALLALLTGCASNPDDKAKQCATAEAAYQAYLADAKLRPVSNDEARIATAAALFLRTYCGWNAARGGVDANGVPVVVAP